MSRILLAETALKGVLTVDCPSFEDERGNFSEVFSEREFGAALNSFGIPPVGFVQENQSTSFRGVVRGLHFQKPPHSQAKLVRCAAGRILDVAVNMRASSPDFGKWITIELSGENHRQLLVPQGFAHGFSVLSDEAVVVYKVSDYYAPECEAGVAWNDPALAIDWKLDPAQIIVNERDREWPLLADAYRF